MDYSKWDVVAAEEDREEQQRKAEQRRKNKEDHFKQQQERIEKHQQQQQQQQTQPASQPAHSPAHHAHAHEHAHGHDSSAPAAASPSQPDLPAYRRTCGCGFTDVDTLLAMQKHAAANPGPSPAEKRQKQLDAILAIRTHAKELYSAQQYQPAYTIYERGSLIIAGMTDMPPAMQQVVDAHELAITHNMALCALQLRNYAHAIELARMALQLTPEQGSDEATKAHFRMLQCYVRLGQWEEAGAKVAEIEKRGGWKGVEDEVKLMRRMKEAEKVKEREFRVRMQETMRLQQEKERVKQKLHESKEGPAIDDR